MSVAPSEFVMDWRFPAQPLTTASFCTGVGGWEIATQSLGCYRSLFFSEIEAFCCSLLAQRWPHISNFGDLLAFDGSWWRHKVDVVWGSPPCQAFSFAGRRKGLKDGRGNLTLAFVDRVDEIEPIYVCFENVKGILSDKTNAFGCLLGALAGEDGPLEPPGGKWAHAGYVLGPARTVAWRLFDAQHGGVLRDEGFEDIVLDNGKWTAHTTGKPWDEPRFLAMVEEFGARAAWLLVPDVVADGAASLTLTKSWLPRLKGKCRLLLVAVQDGMTESEVEALLGPDVGIFLGGSTAWKLATMEAWGRLAARVRCHYHVGRVNTQTRIRLAIAAGADSIDGSSGTRFAVTIEPLTSAARGQDLYSPKRTACAA